MWWNEIKVLCLNWEEKKKKHLGKKRKGKKKWFARTFSLFPFSLFRYTYAYLFYYLVFCALFWCVYCVLRAVCVWFFLNILFSFIFHTQSLSIVLNNQRIWPMYFILLEWKYFRFWLLRFGQSISYDCCVLSFHLHTSTYWA